MTKKLPPIPQIPQRTLTPEERRLARAAQQVIDQQVDTAQMVLMFHQHEHMQRGINAVLARWANEMLTLASTPQETPHDH